MAADYPVGAYYLARESLSWGKVRSEAGDGGARHEGRHHRRRGRRAGRRPRPGPGRALRSRSSRPATRSAAWPPASRSPAGTGRWSSSTTTGSPATGTCLGLIDELGWQDKCCSPARSPPSTTKAVLSLGLASSAPADPAGRRLAPRHFATLPSTLAAALRAGRRCTCCCAARWKPLEKTTADDWLRRWMGKRLLRDAVGAAAGQQVRRALPRGQHGLVLGAGQGAHAAAGHVRGRLPGVPGCARRAGAGRRGDHRV